MVDRTKIRPTNSSLGVRPDRRQDDGDQPAQAVREAEYPGYAWDGADPEVVLYNRSCTGPWYYGRICLSCRKAYLRRILTLAFKSYEQGWQKFQGDGVSFIWLDEEPDDFKVYTECQARLLATGGSMMITFTPLLGETELYQSFARGDDPDKGFVNMTGDDVIAEPHGHLKQESYDRAISSFPAHEQAARVLVGPIMGSGAIFQIMRESIEIPPITEPLGHWRLGWGIDFGGMGGASRKFSHPFAAVLGFYDPITDIIYIAHALQLKNMMPIQHADAMKRVCAGAPVFWPHDGHRRTGDDSPETTAGLYRGWDSGCSQPMRPSRREAMQPRPGSWKCSSVLLPVV
jgi:phage terminase large subunit-like protein